MGVKNKNLDSIRRDEPITQAQYARVRQVTPGAVNAAIREGRLKESVIVVNGRKMLASLDAADLEWEANTKPEFSTIQMNGVYIPKHKIKDMVKAVEEGLESAPDYSTERAWVERYKKELSRIELEVKQGKLIDRQEMLGSLFKALREVRDSLMNLPSKVAPEVVSMDDSFEVQTFLDGQIRECLETLAKWYEQQIGEVGQDAA